MYVCKCMSCQLLLCGFSLLFLFLLYLGNMEQNNKVGNYSFKQSKTIQILFVMQNECLNISYFSHAYHCSRLQKM